MGMTYLYRESSELEAQVLRDKHISTEGGLTTCVRKRTETAAGMSRECIELRPRHQEVATGPETDAGGKGAKPRPVVATAHASMDELMSRGWREISADEGRRFLQNASPPARRSA